MGKLRLAHTMILKQRLLRYLVRYTVTSFPKLCLFLKGNKRGSQTKTLYLFTSHYLLLLLRSSTLLHFRTTFAFPDLSNLMFYLKTRKQEKLKLLNLKKKHVRFCFENFGVILQHLEIYNNS